MSCPRYRVRLCVVGTKLYEEQWLGAALGQYEQIKPYIKTWVKWENMAKRLEDKHGKKIKRFSVELGIRSIEIGVERELPTIKNYKDIDICIEDNICWVKLAKEIESENGGELEVARAWNENYAKGFEPLGGKHHWFPRNKEDEYFKHCKGKENGEE